jgi:hypothetical protein
MIFYTVYFFQPILAPIAHNVPAVYDGVGMERSGMT